MKRTIIFTALLAAAPTAWATNTPPPTPTPVDPSHEQNQGQLQGQAQGQAQGQGQIATGGTGTGVGVGFGQGGAGGQGGQGGNGTAVAGGGAGGRGGSSDQSQNAFSGATSGSSSHADQSLTGTQTTTNTNGGNTTASGASADGSGNADVTIGGDSYTTEGSRFVYQAAMPSAPPVFGPSSAATVSYGQCGPYKAVESAPVNGVYLGMVRKHSIPLGRTDRIVAYNGESFKQKQFPDGRWYLEGQQAIRTTTVLNVSGSRQVSLGGYGTNGGGQAGAGGGSSMQQLISTIDLEPCVAYIAEPAAQVPVIEFKETRVPRG